MAFEGEEFESIRTLVLFDAGDVSEERASPGKMLYEKVAFKDGATWYPLTGDGLTACMEECRSVVEWALAGDGRGTVASELSGTRPASRPAVVIVIASGDAAASVVMSRLVKEGLQQRTAVLPLPCGDGNRLAMTAGFGSSLPQTARVGTNEQVQAWWNATVGRAVDRLTGAAAGPGLAAAGAAVRVDTWKVRVMALPPRGGSAAAGSVSSPAPASRSHATAPPRRASRLYRVLGGAERPTSVDSVACTAVCGVSLGVWAQAEYERRAGRAAAAPSTDAGTCGVAMEGGRVRCDWGSVGTFDRVTQLAGAVVAETATPVTRLLRRVVVDGKVLAEGRSLPPCQALVLPNLPAWSRGTDLWPLASPSAIAWAKLPVSERLATERRHNPFQAGAGGGAAAAGGAAPSPKPARAKPRGAKQAAAAPSEPEEDNPFAADGESEFYGSGPGAGAGGRAAAPVSTSGLYPPGYGPGGKLPPAPAPVPASAADDVEEAEEEEEAAASAPGASGAQGAGRVARGGLPTDRAASGKGGLMGSVASALEGAAHAVGAGGVVSAALAGRGHTAAAASADVLASAEAELAAEEESTARSGVGEPTAADGQIELIGAATLLQLGLACSTGTSVAGGLHRIGRARSLRFELLPTKPLVGSDPDDIFSTGRCAYVQSDADCVKVALPAVVEIMRGPSVAVVLAADDAKLGAAREEEW